tara:strand:+ start:1538 stop:2932 length:1395 start_codon:yes stop_codon:yes gene_type:complete
MFYLLTNYTSKGKILLENKKKEAILLIKEKIFSNTYENNFTILPVNGVPKNKIKKILYKRKSTVNNKISGCVYSNNEKCEELVKEINNNYLYSNPLHPDIYPELIKMESEIIHMIGSLYNLPEEGVGNLTTGGTESTILALRAYKKIKMKTLYFFKPEVLCTKTVHAAVFKACELLDLNIVYVDLDENYIMDVNDLKSKLSFKTCVIIASAPCFPYGLMDPIDKISEIAFNYKVPLHVDACLGGFLTQFKKETALSFKKNIQSISVDPHKFGYAPKGSSLLFWKDKKMRHNQYFISNEWTGGIYASVSLPGSRVGSQIASTWGAILYNGYNSYKNMGNKIMNKTLFLYEKIKNIETFEVIGKPNINVVAFHSTKYSVGQITKVLSKQQWNLNILQNPLCLHICITPKNIGHINNLIFWLNEITKMNVEKKDGTMASIYGMSAELPDKSVVNEIVEYYLDFTTNV